MAEDVKLIERFSKAQENLVLQSADFSLRTIHEMVENESIDIAPKYQRRARWSAEKQSALIESLLINVPIPPIYLSEDEYGTYSVIDGKQRITAIHLFLGGQLVLRDLEKLPELNGRRFSELPFQLSRTLEIRPFIRAVTLLKQSDPGLKYEVFTRLNKGGEQLNAQEVRNVAYRGPLNELIYELSEHDFLHDQLKIQGPKSPSYRDMLDAEYVLRFFALRENWRSYAGSLAGTLDKFMQENQKASPELLGSMRESFVTAVETCQALWGKHAFRRPVDGGWRDQTLAGMWDAQMVAVDMLNHERRSAAIARRESVIAATRGAFDDSKFEQAVRVATNTPSSVRLRIKTMFEIVADAGK